MLDANAAFRSGSTNETGLPVASIGKPTTEPDPAALFVQTTYLFLWTLGTPELSCTSFQTFDIKSAQIEFKS